MRAKGEKMTKLTDDGRLAAIAAEWLRKHRHGVDTSEAYDDLRALLSQVRNDAIDEAARVVDDWIKTREPTVVSRVLNLRK